jgi:hypothetical protein
MEVCLINFNKGKDDHGDLKIEITIQLHKTLFSCKWTIYKHIHLVKPVLKGTQTCSLYEQLPFIYRLNLHTLFINWKNQAVLYRQ